MHVRFTMTVGIPVVDEDPGEELGRIRGILIHPDTGKVEGFFVGQQGLLQSADLFLASEDIRRWGLRIVVRGAHVLSPVEERIRLQPVLEEGRTLLGQRILTDTGRALGRCGDVQFSTELFVTEWIWPRKLWKWGTPFPLSQVLEVRKDAIIVRDPSASVPEKAAEEKAPMINVPEVA